MSIEIDENKKPIIWLLNIGTSYTSLDNTREAHLALPSEMLNTSVGIIHMRPLKGKMSLMAALTVSTHSNHAKLGKIRMQHVLFNVIGGVSWQIRSNLKLGVAGVINNMFDFPMLLPIPIFEWQNVFAEKYELNVNLGEGADISAGIIFSKNFKLRVLTTTSGSLGFDKIDGKKMMFDLHYMAYVIQPKLKFGKFTAIATAGFAYRRIARYKERKLKELFETHSANFSSAPYLSAAIKYDLF